MNIHHLELFYYVAKHGGISEAVRNIPYGIQQPAVSYQVLQLEEYLDTTLFHRRPFALTPTGEKLFRYIEPFFGGLEALGEELRGGAAQQVRCGAAEVVIRDHLPEVFRQVRQKFPKLKLTLREGYHPQLHEWLQKGEIDLAVTLLESKPPPGFNAQPLLSLPLVLLVAKKSRLTSAADLWKRDRIDEPLIALPPTEPICKAFQQGLSRLGRDWFPSIELSSLAMIEAYVAKGFGVGLSVAIPRAKLGPGLRALPLEQIPPVTVGVLWPGKVTPLIQAILDEISREARALKAEV